MVIVYEPNLGDKCWLLQQKKNPKSFTFTMPRELPSISANRVQHASSRLSNIYLINLPKIQSALTLLSTLRLAFMAFCNAPCYKYGVQRWKVQRYHSKLTKHTMINHNQKWFMKNSPLQQKHALWGLVWQRNATK